MPAAVPPSVADLSVPAALLNTAEIGIIHFQPVYALTDATQLIDFVYLRLNPTAQRLLQLPEFPTATFLTLHPKAATLFAFYRDTFLAGEARAYPLSPPAGWRALAQRHGSQLVISLTGIAGPSTAPPRLEASRPAATSGASSPTQQLTQERETLRRVLAQTPAAICLLRGPEYHFEYANPAFAQLFANRALEGLPAAEVLPEVLNQGFITLLDRVYSTGETFWEAEVPWASSQPGGLRASPRYFNFLYQAHLENGHADRLSVFAYEVSEQVLARQQVQRLNDELRASNDELARAQQQLQQLNAALEAQVVAGTREAWQAHAEARQQHRRLTRFFEQLPAAICVLAGPELVYELVNPVYQHYFLGRQLLGQPVEAVPEIAEQTIAVLHQVYDTGVTHEEHQVRLASPDTTQPADLYFDCIYQARYDERGLVDGVLVFAYDVTAKVLAQQHAEKLQTEALASSQRQREAFEQLVAQAPAAIALLRGPEHRVEYVNQAFEQLFRGRARTGQPLAEALPETIPQGIPAQLDHVYQTGEAYTAPELALTIAQFGSQLARVIYLNLTCQAYKENSQTVGILLFALDVSGQVRARPPYAARQA